jgi:hypothetical protein
MDYEARKDSSLDKTTCRQEYGGSVRNLGYMNSLGSL